MNTVYNNHRQHLLFHPPALTNNMAGIWNLELLAFLLVLMPWTWWSGGPRGGGGGGAAGSNLFREQLRCDEYSKVIIGVVSTFVNKGSFFHEFYREVLPNTNQPFSSFNHSVRANMSI